MDSSIYRLLLLEGLKPILQLEETAETLFKETGRLRALRSDIESHLVALETPQLKRSGQVENWMQEVDSLNEEVAEFEESFIRRRIDCLGICCSLASLSTYYHLGMRAINMLRHVRDLNAQAGSFTSFVDQPPPEMDQTSSSVSVVGAEDTLSAIREYLNKDDVKILGIYGMGGIGKTALLSQIKNEMSKTRTQFDLVIWVTVSRHVNVLNIKNTISEQLSPSLNIQKTRGKQVVSPPSDERAEISNDVLSKMKILLILDDVWERLDLERIGVPLPISENKWKIAITTRSEQVCFSMGAQYKIKVPPLRHDESWELFREKVGVEVDIDSPSIRQLAERVVEKCGGLPLALVTVGGAMVDATTAAKWEGAIEKLGNPHNNDIRGMQDMFSILKFSYDGLENNTLRHCLLLCSLYPEDYDININDLIDHWVGGGILDGGTSDSLNSARNQGRSVINKLKAACLLESGKDEGLFVKLHDGVRDMILWMSSGDCNKTTSGDCDNFVFFSYAGLGLAQFPSVKRWGEARWISIMSNEIEEVPDEIPNCPNLLVLNMNSNSSLGKSIPDSFFTFTPFLRFLNLTNTGIEELPKSIGSLVELRYLDVSWSGIMSLPEEIGNLAKLKILDLRGTEQLAVVPRESILKLSSLQLLNISVSSYTWDSNDGSDGQEISGNHEDLEGLKQLESLGLTIGTSHFLEKLLSSPVWSKAMECLSLKGKDMTSAMISRTCEVMKILNRFEIMNNDELEEFIFGARQLTKLRGLKLWELPLLTRIAVRKEDNDEVVGVSERCCLLPSLRELKIWNCHKLEDLNWVSQISALTFLDLFDCPGIEDLIVDGCEEKEEETKEYAPLFPNLITMNLEWLPNLRSISRRLLLLPSLEYLHVSGCPQLKKLPFTNDSAKKIKVIRGTQQWWNELDWEDDIRSTFFPHFSNCLCDFCEREIQLREEAEGAAEEVEEEEEQEAVAAEEEEEEEEEENGRAQKDGRAPEHGGEEEDARE